MAGRGQERWDLTVWQHDMLRGHWDYQPTVWGPRPLMGSGRGHFLPRVSSVSTPGRAGGGGKASHFLLSSL